MMGKISLSYPDTGLTISISVKNRDTGVEVFSGSMTEVGTSKTYTYDFTETTNVDYVYVATVSGYSPMSGVVYRDGGGLTYEQDAKLTQIDSRVDKTVSTLGSGILYNKNNYFDYTRLTTGFEEIKKELRKEIKDIEKIDITSVIKELEDIKKAIPKKDKAAEIVTITKLNAIEKKIDEQIDEEKRKKEADDKETENVVDILDKEEDRLEEIEDIVNSLNKEEIKYIIKLLK